MEESSNRTILRVSLLILRYSGLLLSMYPSGMVKKTKKSANNSDLLLEKEHNDILGLSSSLDGDIHEMKPRYDLTVYGENYPSLVLHRVVNTSTTANLPDPLGMVRLFSILHHFSNHLTIPRHT